MQQLDARGMLTGVEMQTSGRGDVCVNGSAEISGDDFKEVFVTSLGEVRS